MKRLLVFLLLLPSLAWAQKPPINGVAGPTTSAQLQSIITDATGSGPLNFGATALNIQVGTTAVGGGTSPYLLYNNAGVLGNTTSVSPYSVTSTGSITARTLASRFAEVINVLDYGASPANTGAQNTTAFRAAVTAGCSAAEVDKAIFVPPGRYSVDLSANIAFDVTCIGLSLIGSGQSTVFLPTGTNDLVRFYGPDPAGGLLLGRGTISGFQSYRTDNPAAGAAIKLERVANITINDLQLDGSFRAFDCVSCFRVFATNFRTLGNNTASDATGLMFRRDATGYVPAEIFFDNFNIRPALLDGTGIQNNIVITNADGLFFTNGHVGFTSAENIKVQADGPTSQLYNIYLNNVSMDKGTYGFRLMPGGGYAGIPIEINIIGGNVQAQSVNAISVDSGIAVEQMAIVGNTIDNTGQCGINIQGGSNYTVTGNNLRRSNQANGGYSQICIGGAATVASVAGNNFFNGTGSLFAAVHDVLIADTSSVVTVKANIHSGSSGVAVSATTSGTSISYDTGANRSSKFASVTGNFDQLIVGSSTLYSVSNAGAVTASAVTIPLGGTFTFLGTAFSGVTGGTNLVGSNSPTLTTPVIGTATGTSLSLVATNAFLTNTGAAGTFRNISYRSGSSERWAVGVSNTAESGANAGTDFTFSAFDDAAVFLGNWIQITRSNGAIVMPGTVRSNGGFNANGSAGLSATTTVRDSAGTGTCTLIFTLGIKTGGSC